MWTFVIVQEEEQELHLLVSSVIQISISNPNNNIVCACNQEYFDILEKYFSKNVNLIHYKLNINSSHKKNLKYFLLNWINTFDFAIKNYEHPIYVPSSIVLVNKVPITQELIDQKVCFIKLRQTFSAASDENKIINPEDAKKNKANYSMSLFYISSLHALNVIKKYFSKESKLFEEESKIDYDNIEEIKSLIVERKKYAKLWRELPLLFADMDDGTISITKYISHDGYLTTGDFFTLDKPYSKNDLFVQEGLIKHKEDTIWGMSISTILDERVIVEINSKLSALLIAYNNIYLPIINMKYSKSILRVITPKKINIAHWNRENDTFYNYLESLCDDNKLIDYCNTENQDHFYISNYVLYDKPDSKYIIPTLRNSYGLLYFDYNNELLDTFDDIDIKNIFIGYYSYYPKVLEEFNDPKDVTRMGTKTLKEKEYTNEEEFSLYLDDLSTFKYFTIDKNTPKNRIAECLRLGVVPRVLDNTKLLDIEDIAKDEETEWEILSEKCKEYYTKNLSIEAITGKLVKINFNM